jgi:hypothetical protein
LLMLQSGSRVGAPPTHQFRTVNVVALIPVPLGVVTSIVPLVAPDGTVNLILVAVSLLIAATTPPIVTEVAPSSAVPVTVTSVPTAPEVG